MTIARLLGAGGMLTTSRCGSAIEPAAKDCKRAMAARRRGAASSSRDETPGVHSVQRSAWCAAGAEGDATEAGGAIAAKSRDGVTGAAQPTVASDSVASAAETAVARRRAI